MFGNSDAGGRCEVPPSANRAHAQEPRNTPAIKRVFPAALRSALLQAMARPQLTHAGSSLGR